MQNLGFDILLSIFDLLVQEDKLECMTVCQQWYDIIYTHSLFRDIYVDNRKQLDQLIGVIQKDSAVGEKVEKFVLEFPLDSKFDSNMFFELFPNLRYCALHDMRCASSTSVPLKLHHTYPWCRQIKRFEGVESTVKTLLLSGLCINLTYISMRGQRITRTRDFIEPLVNAPALKILDLNTLRISLEDIELLHNTVPLLDSLWLSYVSFESTSSPLSITSATSVKSLRCTDLDFDSSYDSTAFILYISKKYTLVEELTLNYGCIIYDCPISEQDRIAIASYIETLGPRLKRFSLIFDCEDMELYEAFDIGILDASGCQIEKLELGYHVELDTLERLAETTQAQNVRSLAILGVDYIQSTGFDSFPFWWILRFKSLKELEIQHHYNYSGMPTFILNLNDMLENLCETHLERLELHHVYLQFHESSRVPVYPSLKSLTLDKFILETGTDAFISKAFPNLKRLSLNNYRGLKESFTFPNLDLSYLEMTNNTKNETFPVMIITLGDGRRQWYNKRSKKYVFQYHRASYCQSFDKLDIKPMVTITCHSVYDFQLIVGKIIN